MATEHSTTHRCPDGSPHHWLLEPGKSTSVHGVCKHCKAKQVFRGTARIGHKELPMEEATVWQVSKHAPRHVADNTDTTGYADAAEEASYASG